MDQKTQRSRAFPPTLCHGVARIFLTAPLSYDAVAIHRGQCEQLLRYVKLATSSIEQFSYGAGKGVAIAPPDQANSHSIFSWRDYGNRVGVWRLFELFDTLNMPVEAQMNIAVYEHCPDIPAKLRQRGDEILGHGITNSEEQGHLSEDAEATLIRTVTETIT